ncbi:hypothetical protein [Streptomyces sp. NPDC057412]|uniref:hypothetical protein n=1 Tax=Streptomyces sp. NPDC057412 TaxID=3346123 RepID=UPI0036C7CDBF
MLTELAECVERSTSLEPSDCPISPDGCYWEEDAEDVVWKQKSEPVLQTELADDGTVSVTGDLDLKVTWIRAGTVTGASPGASVTCGPGSPSSSS